MQTDAGSGPITWLNPGLNDYQVIVFNATSKILGIAVETNITGSVDISVSVFSGAHGRAGLWLGNLTGSSSASRRRSTVSMVTVSGSVAITANQLFSLVFQITSNSGGSGLIGLTSAQYPPGYFHNSITGTNNTNAIFTASMRLWYPL